jgi:hypothetical protein
MYRDCSHRGEKVRNVHNVQQVDTVEDMGQNVSKIYIVLDNKQAKWKARS